MPNQQIKEGNFAFVIKVKYDPEGVPDYSTHVVNQSVPLEIVMMQMSAFLHKIRQEYFKDFDDGAAMLKKD